ncbi:MAG: NAD(P)/FAD-dependent oxidoreductase, partial [Victivallales bacterium]|nr:NAD(P)/FAD-dependent oxidoreductase [Victivallales bacterium]
AAGEVLDIDGPTGGYNLHAAFASARLAIEHLAAVSARHTAQTFTNVEPPDATEPTPRSRSPRGKSNPPRDPRKSAWGKHFWDGHRPVR